MATNFNFTNWSQLPRQAVTVEAFGGLAPEAVFRWDGCSPGQDRVRLTEELGEVGVFRPLLDQGNEGLVAK